MSAIFFLVVLYLIIGATVFKALEQPNESLQKLAILAEKLEFLNTHDCVNSSELEDLVKVGKSTNTTLVIIISLLLDLITDKFYSFVPVCKFLSVQFKYSSENKREQSTY